MAVVAAGEHGRDVVAVALEGGVVDVAYGAVVALLQQILCFETGKDEQPILLALGELLV